MRAAYGQVNHIAREDELNVALCGVQVIAAPDSETAWTLCRKCERIEEGQR